MERAGTAQPGEKEYKYSMGGVKGKRQALLGEAWQQDKSYWTQTEIQQIFKCKKKSLLL